MKAMYGSVAKLFYIIRFQVREIIKSRIVAVVYYNCMISSKQFHYACKHIYISVYGLSLLCESNINIITVRS